MLANIALEIRDLKNWDGDGIIAQINTEEEAETVSTDTEIDSEFEAQEVPQPDETMGDEQEEDSESNEPKDETTIVNEDLVPDVDEEKLDSSEDEPLQET